MVVWTQSSTGVNVEDMVPNLGFKQIMVRTPATFVNGTDTITVDLNRYGATKLAGIFMFQETTAGSVVVLSAVHASTGSDVGLTTTVASGVLTITPLLPANTCITNFVILAY